MNRIAIGLLLAFAISIPAHAGIFLDIRTIPGDSVDVQHADEIPVLTWAQSVANINNMPVVLPLVFTHSFDKASPKLVEAALLGTDLEEATLAVTTTGLAVPYDYIILKLIQPRVVSVYSGGAEGNMAVETVTLTCTSFELQFVEDDDGSPGQVTEVNGSCGN